MRFKKEQILEMFSEVTNRDIGDWKNREIFVSEFNGYGQDCYHATFFAVNGSPLRVVGYLATFQRGYQMVVTSWRLKAPEGTCKSYFFDTDGKKTTKDRLMGIFR